MNQDERAKMYAEEEMENVISWRGNSLMQIFELKELFLPVEEKQKKGYQNLEKFKDYPNHVAGGETWLRVSKEILERDSIVTQIERFYKERYRSMIRAMRPGNIMTDKPIWIVTNKPKLKRETVYPVIVEYREKDCIVLLINEGEAI